MVFASLSIWQRNLLMGLFVHTGLLLLVAWLWFLRFLCSLFSFYCHRNVFSRKRQTTQRWESTGLEICCDNCCSRWYFTFNGAECSTPAAIDGVVYMAYGRDGKYAKSLYCPRHIEGVCEKSRKRTVRVGFWVGKCSDVTSADAYTGWNSVSRIYVDEIPPQA